MLDTKPAIEMQLPDNLNDNDITCYESHACKNCQLHNCLGSDAVLANNEQACF